MKKIGCIHTFEDRAFLSRVSHVGIAVLVTGAIVAVAWYIASEFEVPLLPGFEAAGLFASGLGAWWVAAVVAGAVLPLLVHELVHGALFFAWAPAGSRVGFGMNKELGMLYACADGVVYPRGRYLAIILAPTFVVTLLVILVGAAAGWPLWTIVATFLHLSGCSGDWEYARRMLLDPDIAYCEDTSWGVQFYAAACGQDGIDERGDSK